MYKILSQSPILAIIFIVLVVALLVFLLVKLVQKLGLEKVRTIVYKGFVKAEREFQKGENSQKFDFVCQLARSSIPAPFNLFVTESILRNTIQLWFDLTKDLLDDGKFNGTGQQTKEVLINE